MHWLYSVYNVLSGLTGHTLTILCIQYTLWTDRTCIDYTLYTMYSLDWLVMHWLYSVNNVLSGLTGHALTILCIQCNFSQLTGHALTTPLRCTPWTDQSCIDYILYTLYFLDWPVMHWLFCIHCTLSTDRSCSDYSVYSLDWRVMHGLLCIHCTFWTYRSYIDYSVYVVLSGLTGHALTTLYTMYTLDITVMNWLYSVHIVLSGRTGHALKTL